MPSNSPGLSLCLRLQILNEHCLLDECMPYVGMCLALCLARCWESLGAVDGARRDHMFLHEEDNITSKCLKPINFTLKAKDCAFEK